MGHLELHLTDTADLGDDLHAPEPYREWYTVTTELFKRGRVWEPGDRIDLDPATGAAMVAAGDVTPADPPEETP